MGSRVSLIPWCIFGASESGYWEHFEEITGSAHSARETPVPEDKSLVH